MKKIILSIMAVGLLASSALPQSEPKPEPVGVETLLLLPKRGMEEKFETAVVVHNKKFHPDGPQVAGLRKIEYGKRAGWYLWVSGPKPYGSFDSQFSKESGHDQDWNATIDPSIEQYGETSFWNFDTELSYGLDLVKNAKHFEAWMVDLKPKQYYRFKSLMEKLRKVSETEKKGAFLVLENNLHGPDVPEVMLVWSFDSYKEWQEDPGPKVTWEKLYGVGTWQTAMDEWRDIIVDYTSEIRTNIK